jgi:hypothetical protein
VTSPTVADQGSSHGTKVREGLTIERLSGGHLPVRKIDAAAIVRGILENPARSVVQGSIVVPTTGQLSGEPATGRIDRGGGDRGGTGGGGSSDDPTPANPGSDTTPNNGTGHVIADANIHLLFWGHAWLSAATQPTMTAVIHALNSLVSGPFWGRLPQYGVQHAQIADSAVVDLGLTTSAPTNFTQADCTTLIEALISEGLLPTLTNATGYNEVFALILPSAPPASSRWTFSGYHNYATNSQGKNVYFLVVTSSGEQLDAITACFSHEIVECCTDPDFNEIKFSNSGENEIADICENQFGGVNNVLVQKYWSQTELACVLPTQPNATGPAGSDRTLPVAARVTINAGGTSPKSEVFNFTRVVGVNNNQTTAVAVITTPAVNGLSANIVLNFSWNSDFSVNVNFTSAFFSGLSAVTSYANNFDLQPGYTEFYQVGHEINNNFDTCAISFNVVNNEAA